MLYFEHHYKFRTIPYSLELKNYTKLWVHENWGRTETGDTTVLGVFFLFFFFLGGGVGGGAMCARAKKRVYICTVTTLASLQSV